MIRFIVTIILASALSGCYRTTYRVSPDKGAAYKSERWANFFIFGVVPDQESFPYDSFCLSDSIAEVTTVRKPSNVISTIFGVGLTGAYTVEASCVRDKKG